MRWQVARLVLPPLLFCHTSSEAQQRLEARATRQRAEPYSIAAAANSPADPIFDARGFHPNRDAERYLPFEHIDPFTGNLLLTFTDLVLPANGGFDLRIQRSCNSKIFTDYQFFYLNEDSWAGLGWTLHLGRVLLGGDRAVIEMPDGSHHPVYSFANFLDTVTKDFWRYDASRNPPVLSLPNGVRYYFGHVGNILADGRGTLYVTRLDDPYGNVVTITYAVASDPNAPRDAIRQITQHLENGRTRTVMFDYEPALKSLRRMELRAGAHTSTWTFDQVPLAHHPASPVSLLTAVRPPVSPPWRFGYNTTRTPWYELASVTLPQGGTVAYTHDFHWLQYCSLNPFPPISLP